MTEAELTELAASALADDTNGLAKMDPATAVAVYAEREHVLATALLGLLTWKAALETEMASRGPQGSKVFEHICAAVDKRLAGPVRVTMPLAPTMPKDPGGRANLLPEGVTEATAGIVQERLRRRGKKIVDAQHRPSRKGFVITLHHQGCDDEYEVMLTDEQMDLTEDMGRLYSNRLLEAVDCPCGHAVEVA